MNAYTGTEPYVFLSYSHADWERAQEVIIGLKQHLCRIWYDEGLTPGESWNDDLAEHLKNAEVVIILLTKQSAMSQYVKTEVNYAISRQKKLLPVLLEHVDLPAGLEMMLSSIQYLDLSQSKEDVEKKISLIISNLPRNVFASKKVPFFETNEYSFYMEKEISVNGASASEKRADSFSIICRQNNGEVAEKLFEFHGTKAYDIDFTITQCKTIDDDYFVGNIRGLQIFNVLAKCELDYPLIGPDFQLLLIMVLRIPEDGFPTVSLIDYQYIHVIQAKVYEGKKLTNLRGAGILMRSANEDFVSRVIYINCANQICKLLCFFRVRPSLNNPYAQ